MIFLRSLIAIFCACVVHCPSSLVYADGASAQAIPSEKYVSYLESQLETVAEFAYIRQQAKIMGVQVWLFGGTAAAFAHYVKWDLLHKLGNSAYQPDRFDYAYSNIFRSTQDLDIVIDGTAEQANDLEALLTTKFQYIEGGKTAWEVRMLKGTPGTNSALLDDKDFFNQHTDSHSTGMIEITKSKEPVVRDIRAWSIVEPPFLKDVLAGQITYYFSKKHFETEMAKNGDNPEIFSAIRLLTKAFQYELTIVGSGLEKVQSVVRQFEPTIHITTPYAKRRVQRLGTNIIRHAVNLEYAGQVINELGLKNKLLSLGDPKQVNTMAWWVNRKPLPSFLVGEKGGKTARDLGYDIVAHETINFVAYESITRAHTGAPNVFVSRGDSEGEVAAHGEGFYTQIGQKGARNSGFHIRFHLNPEAREGYDFTVFGKYILIKNKAALTVIQESLAVSLLEYFTMLHLGQVDLDEKGQLEKFKRKISHISEIDTEEENFLVDLILLNHLLNSSDFKTIVLNEWFSLPISAKYPEFAQMAFREDYYDNQTTLEANSNSRMEIRKGPAVMQAVFNNPHWQPHWDMLIAQLKEEDTGYQRYFSEIIDYVFPSSCGSQCLEIMRSILKVGSVKDLTHLAREVLSTEQWVNQSWIVEELLLLNNPDVDLALVHHVIRSPYWKMNSKFISNLIDRNNTQIDVNLLTLFSTRLNWRVAPEWKGLVTKIFKNKKSGPLSQFVGELSEVERIYSSSSVGEVLPLLFKEILDHTHFSQIFGYYVKRFSGTEVFIKFPNYIWVFLEQATSAERVQFVKDSLLRPMDSLPDEILDRIINEFHSPEVDQLILSHLDILSKKWKGQLPLEETIKLARAESETHLCPLNAGEQ